MFVTDSNKIAQFKELIQNSDKITMVCHTHPDGDAAGSCIGMTRFLSELKKDAVAVFPDPVPEFLNFLTNSDKIIIFNQDEEKGKQRLLNSDLIILMDANSFIRTAEMESCLRETCCKKILIDHHLNPEISCFDLVFSTPDISSTCELSYYILKEVKSKLSKSCMEALFTGMTTDTNNFANSVFPSTFKMASEIIESGVDRDKILQNIYNRYKESVIRFMGLYLSELMQIEKGKVAYAIITEDLKKQFGIKEGDTEGFVNIPLGIKNIDISIFLKEDNGKYRVSLRSKSDIPVNKMAEKFFNGGGHKNAAGGTITIGKDIADKKDLQKYLKNAIIQFLQNK